MAHSLTCVSWQKLGIILGSHAVEPQVTRSIAFFVVHGQIKTSDGTLFEAFLTSILESFQIMFIDESLPCNDIYRWSVHLTTL